MKDLVCLGRKNEEERGREGRATKDNKDTKGVDERS
jgi:hypothetical protein